MRVAFLKEAREGQCGNQVVSQAEKSPVLVVMQLVIRRRRPHWCLRKRCRVTRRKWLWHR